MSLLLLRFVSRVRAGAVAVYVAYPRRGQQVPHAPWLGELMKRGVASLPTIDNHPRRPLELQPVVAPVVRRVRGLVHR